MFGGVKVKTGAYGSFKEAINEAGWLKDEVVAAGHLRHGRAARMSVGRPSGLEQVQLLLPRRSKKLPRHFVLAVTADEVVAFRATEVGGDSNATIYTRLKIREGVYARYPRRSVSMSDLPEGPESRGGTITIEGDSFPVMRPNPYGDPNTNELIAVLAEPSELA
ncbi:MAG TPA: hypothetical protein VF715_17490 [Thermoleophilaceae bacterium]